MATGRAPWSNFGNHFAALYHIGCTDELPHVPASLSEEAHDFLSHCFQRDPAKRWTSAHLLQHPFLTTRFVAAPVALKAPASPISVMQFPVDFESDLSASFVNSVPTLTGCRGCAHLREALPRRCCSCCHLARVAVRLLSQSALRVGFRVRGQVRVLRLPRVTTCRG
ncbi:hypothetical protein KC19_2G269200 [Ceratodon purpureus]|uniref:Protein kinase domain-containing protein n=1 Tax=Ceratodon purpureus TaxID=3225 RepID=A0A8T0J1N5_CERPU|nr:hypothetical protein KC19_2G269200 [Ceratodon purpureus]